jgi:hypothetical protein
MSNQPKQDHPEKLTSEKLAKAARFLARFQHARKRRQAEAAKPSSKSPEKDGSMARNTR